MKTINRNDKKQLAKNVFWKITVPSFIAVNVAAFLLLPGFIAPGILIIDIFVSILFYIFEFNYWLAAKILRVTKKYSIVKIAGRYIVASNNIVFNAEWAESFSMQEAVETYNALYENSGRAIIGKGKIS